MTADISRLFRDPEKRFHGLVHQQGRLPIDAEENHGTDIAQWTDEERFVETIAPSGSPDDGFKIVAVTSGGGNPTDFTIRAGSYYLGGSRVENPADLKYRKQSDQNWLTFPLDENPDSIAANQTFLVWLDAREAVVTATEDSELLEPGLGGPDTTARKRFSWRVRATAVPGPGCIKAAQQWLDVQQWTGKVDAATGLLASGATLKVTFNPADVDQDLCKPSLVPGFLGARNECYRVMVTRPGHYVWGQDDAAPLYRVRVEADSNGNPRRIRFLTRPRDEFALPRAGQTIELLRWDELLPNGQKTAEARGGFFKVTGGYVDGAITLGTNVPTAWTTWLAGQPAGPHDDETHYFYLRLWTGEGVGANPDIPFGNPNLTGTGLALTFAGAPMPGDSWVIAARPNAPTQVMPWALLDGMAAHAPRHHVVPLAFVELGAGGPKVTDCRRRFRPLYKIGGCCTVTVGDGVSSWGDVSTIADALARLPASGGEICIGPGTYKENIQILGRSNVTFSGCGARTRWIADNPALPLLEIRNCERIIVRRLRMEGGLAQCIFAGVPGGAPAAQRNRDLRFEELELAAPSGSAIVAKRLDGLLLRLSTVAVGPFPAGPPPVATKAFAAVHLQGDRLLVERNSIVAALGPNDLPSQRPLGGIHIGGDSRTILIWRNEITGGSGNGVTLGSIRLIQIQTVAWQQNSNQAVAKAIRDGIGMPQGFDTTIDAAGCIHVLWYDPRPKGRPGGIIELPVSDGLVVDVRIEKNRIAGMGASGIATFPMYLTLDSGEPAQDAVGVERLLVLDNMITGCMTLEPPPVPAAQLLFMGFGGVALGIVVDCVIRDNRILDNGVTRKQGVCGVFVGIGEEIMIERNCIQNNGGGQREAGSPAPAGGIYACFVVGGADPDTKPAGDKKLPERDRPALWVQDNVVHAPRARALRATALGPVQIVDNRLIGSNPSQFFAQPFFSIIVLLFAGQSVQEMLADPNTDLDLDDLLLLNLVIGILGGDAVNLLNLGAAREAELDYWIRDNYQRARAGAGGFGDTDMQMAAAPAQPPPPPPTRSGETMFADNQVSLTVLHSEAGRDNPGTLSSVLIFTRDDLSFADNQLRIEKERTAAFADAVLWAASVRASSNRALEAVLCRYSLMSFAEVNTTMGNQCTFEILAAAADPTKLVAIANLTKY